ncbi:Ni/Fe-hydrogenase, b-type cytochrome subunit [Shewanella sp. D64]|uniref:Ni/Fe-hydrogenase, b-type cytochrome subunit n=1 Tax=unclassified Shewanella TaxID=196818 RepID=UPI0022BA5A8B|nr:MULTISPECIES: Ni/Fe-hydrogenase, b-type cytochrome subunit [unclassified Shewanella]MEC4725372.1 Ni/Fe-hydrogenase, b-type cytochrome subunit [Shewanella sp. D64]MEC4735782.1 Ni/Fe-hydrogenase, b-type cytochrome subunit [Shewanella sp. E94]WBJ93246.1 Ni/Fe-hydrogenase, b-type cytochrome subunit [Shewanella sp. MTB7]
MSHSATHTRALIFSPAIRIFHWFRALSILVLVVTGFYISWPFLVAPETTDVQVQSYIRFAHLVFGFMLTAVTLVRFYLFFFGKSDIERRSIKDVLSIKSWITQLKSYLWSGHLHKAGIYGPLQFVTYAAISFAALFICITGLVLYANVYHLGMGGMMWEPAAWITAQMGGLAQVRIWHHYLTWVFVIFTLIHVYMAVWSGIRFKHNSVDSIVSGYDYHKE